MKWQKSIKNGRKSFQLWRLNYKEHDQVYTTFNALKETYKKEGESKMKKKEDKRFKSDLLKVRQRRSNSDRSLWRRKPK